MLLYSFSVIFLSSIRNALVAVALGQIGKGVARLDLQSTEHITKVKKNQS